MAYVYLHRRNDTLDVFYVGIGLTEDPTHKRAYCKHSRNPYWHNIVNKAGYSVIILKDNITKAAAQEFEIALINYYGRKELLTGSLVNMSKGGNGGSEKGRPGKPHTEEFKLKQSKIHKNKILSEETKKKISTSKKGKAIKQKGKMTEEQLISYRINRAANKAKKKI